MIIAYLAGLVLTTATTEMQTEGVEVEICWLQLPKPSLAGEGGDVCVSVCVYAPCQQRSLLVLQRCRQQTPDQVQQMQAAVSTAGLREC